MHGVVTRMQVYVRNCWKPGSRGAACVRRRPVEHNQNLGDLRTTGAQTHLVQLCHQHHAQRADKRTVDHSEST
jgi:hypothetical protein